jgi:hypothetical protein
MPNCDFYGTLDDHREVLSWLFSEGTCDVYELSSEFEKPLAQFKFSEEVLRLFERHYPNGERQTSVHLQLYVIGSGPAFAPRRVALKPEFCNGARFRFAAEGWGLVQLYLSAPKSDLLGNSHTNHNSRKRAEAWAPTYPEPPRPEDWDFDRITAFSSRLNRQIRKLSVGKVHSRAVLPGALEVWRSGIALWPYKPGQHVLEMKD